ncbi:hypothetical protein [Streptomyces flaveolus]|uniref:hypothetical protein n=1 Tax=Streptomyces flaveolus TaxID=67297 RepID=UPI00381DB755
MRDSHGWSPASWIAVDLRVGRDDRSTDAVVQSAMSTAPARLMPKRTSIDCGERTQPSRTVWSKSARADPAPGGGLLGSERGVVGV